MLDLAEQVTGSGGSFDNHRPSADSADMARELLARVYSDNSDAPKFEANGNKADFLDHKDMSTKPAPTPPVLGGNAVSSTLDDSKEYSGQQGISTERGAPVAELRSAMGLGDAILAARVEATNQQFDLVA